MACQELHADRQHAEQAPGRTAGAQPFVRREQQQRYPGHRREVGQVPGVDVEEKRRAEHEHGRPREGRGGMQRPAQRPQVHEGAEQPYIQRNGPIRGLRRGQDEEQPVDRVEQRGLHAAVIRRATEDMRVPERHVAAGELAKTEFPPGEELPEQVGRCMTEHARARRNQDIEEHRQHQRAEARQADRHVMRTHQKKGTPKGTFSVAVA
jgi:hypothetical protein